MDTAQFDLHEDIEEHHWWFVARRKIISDVIHAILPLQSLIVDVGCGTGANIASLIKDYKCVGIDPSRQGILSAQKRFPVAKFICGYAPQDLDEQSRAADLFMLNDVLEHVEDDYGFLRSLVSAMKPGAQLLITVPADMSLWTQHDVSFGHFRRYDPQTLSAVWADLNVNVMLLSYYNARLYPAVKVVRMLNKLRGGSQGVAGTDFRMPGKFINKILVKIFAGESHTIRHALQSPSVRGYARGVSLIAVIQKPPLILTDSAA